MEEARGFAIRFHNRSNPVTCVARLLVGRRLRDAMAHVGGARFDIGVNGRQRLDPYGVVNLSVEYTLRDEILLRTRIDNLLDTDYEEVLGFGTAGLSGYVGVTFRLVR